MDSITGRAGTFVVTRGAGETVREFRPAPLPPNPPLKLGGLQTLHEEASRNLGRLDGIASILPDTDLFIFMYVRKEALLSSQIEGTQSSLSDLLLFETDDTPASPIEDVREVSNYVNAMNSGLEKLAGGLPVSTRLMRDVHSLLLASGRGSGKQPGEFRRSQNWIGGTRPGTARYVPPPPQLVPECMSDLEKFIHSAGDLPPLVRAGLAHSQFETIHPFLDGNGRLGRLLITLMLCADGVLQRPVLYLSLFFKMHRAQYYDLLQSVRDDGDWEAWIEFFLEGVKETAAQAADAARAIFALIERDRARIDKLGRATGSALRVHQFLLRRPYASAPVAARELRLSAPTARATLKHLEDIGIVQEATGARRGKFYVYRDYFNILEEGTEPL